MGHRDPRDVNTLSHSLGLTLWALFSFVILERKSESTDPLASQCVLAGVHRRGFAFVRGEVTDGHAVSFLPDGGHTGGS